MSLQVQTEPLAGESFLYACDIMQERGHKTIIDKKKGATHIDANA